MHIQNVVKKLLKGTYLTAFITLAIRGMETRVSKLKLKMTNLSVGSDARFTKVSPLILVVTPKKSKFEL